MIGNVARVRFDQVLSHKPSYTIANSPKIDRLYYITYVLGAAGTWIGFSFMSIEPVPLLEWIISFIIRRKSNSVSNSDAVIDQSGHSDGNVTFTMIQKINLTKARIHSIDKKYGDEITRLKSNIDNLNGKYMIEIGENRNEITRIKELLNKNEH